MTTYTDTERKRLIAIVGKTNEILAITCAKIYTTAKDAEYWLYSDLEGFLCYVMNYEEKTRYLHLYDTETYELLLKLELYKDFEKFYTKVTENFHTFEVNNGFIGLQFYDGEEANLFNVIVKKFNDEISKMLLSINPTKKQGLNTQKTNEIIQMFKKKITKEIKTNQDFNDDYTNEDLEIVNPREFELLENIIYDKDTKKFVIGEISHDLKKIFHRINVDISQLEDDKGFALKFIMIFIKSYAMCQKGKLTGTIMKKNRGLSFNKMVERTTTKKQIEDLSNLRFISRSASKQRNGIKNK